MHLNSKLIAHLLKKMQGVYYFVLPYAMQFYLHEPDIDNYIIIFNINMSANKYNLFNKW